MYVYALWHTSVSFGMKSRQLCSEKNATVINTFANMKEGV